MFPSFHNWFVATAPRWFRSRISCRADFRYDSNNIFLRCFSETLVFVPLKTAISPGVLARYLTFFEIEQFFLLGYNVRFLQWVSSSFIGERACELSFSRANLVSCEFGVCQWSFSVVIGVVWILVPSPIVNFRSETVSFFLFPGVFERIFVCRTRSACHFSCRNELTRKTIGHEKTRQRSHILMVFFMFLREDLVFRSC